MTIQVYADISARKKAEKEALLAAEEAALPTKKVAPKAGQKKKEQKQLAPGGIISGSFSTGDPLGLGRAKGADGQDEPVTELSATGIDGMLEALELVNQKTDKDTIGAKVSWLHFHCVTEADGKASLIEKHPERRFKAAFEAYLEREMPRARDEVSPDT